MVTLGVHDLARARAFYEALGWSTRAKRPLTTSSSSRSGGSSSPSGTGRAARPQTTGGRTTTGGWGGITLAHNVRSPPQVDAVVDRGTRLPERVCDSKARGDVLGRLLGRLHPIRDGHPWEIAHNPRWTLGDDGAVRLAP